MADSVLMADLDLIRPYPALERHRRELHAAARKRQRGLFLGGPLLILLVGALFTISPPGALLVAAVSVMLGFFVLLPGGSSVDPGELAGVEGEHATLQRLRALPDDFRVINRVRLPDPRLPNGERELDFLVIGPTGLWVIEVKNTPGLIQVVPGARHWPLARRAGCSSCPSWNAMDNPEFQVRDQLDAVRQFLLLNGIAVEPRGVICLAHPEVAVRDGASLGLPVLVPDQLVSHITGRAPGPLPDGLNALFESMRNGGHALHSAGSTRTVAKAS